MALHEKWETFWWVCCKCWMYLFTVSFQIHITYIYIYAACLYLESLSKYSMVASDAWCHCVQAQESMTVACGTLRMILSGPISKSDPIFGWFRVDMQFSNIGNFCMDIFLQISNNEKGLWKESDNLLNYEIVIKFLSNQNVFAWINFYKSPNFVKTQKLLPQIFYLHLGTHSKGSIESVAHC